MRILNVHLLGFHLPDGDLDFGVRPTKAVLIRGPVGSGKTRLCSLLTEALRATPMGSGSRRFARSEDGCAKATFHARLSDEEVASLGTGSEATFESFFGVRPAFDASLEDDPSHELLLRWQTKGELAGMVADDRYGEQGLALLYDIATSTGPEHDAPRRRALVEALAALGLSTSGLLRDGPTQMAPAFETAAGRIPFSALSRGQQAAVCLLARVAAAPERFLVLDGVDLHFDDALAQGVLDHAVALFDGWQIFIATRRESLTLAEASVIDL